MTILQRLGDGLAYAVGCNLFRTGPILERRFRCRGRWLMRWRSRPGRKLWAFGGVEVGCFRFGKVFPFVSPFWSKDKLACSNRLQGCFRCFHIFPRVLKEN
jgi:hypothetical protein